MKRVIDEKALKALYPPMDAAFEAQMRQTLRSLPAEPERRGARRKPAAALLAAAVLVFLCILPQIETLTSTFREWAELSGMPEVFGALLKALGIVLIGRITADLCKDAGESAIASGVELAVKTAVLLTALPLLNRLLSLLQEVLLL